MAHQIGDIRGFVNCGFRHFAAMPAAELEHMAERLARAIAPVLAGDLPDRAAEPARRDAA